MALFKCKVCGITFEAPNRAEAVCPVCGADGENLEELQSEHQNKYAGTKTERNLEAAFAGESQARNKYTFFAAKAKQDGFEQIAQIFQTTADNEKEHAEIWFKELGGIGTTARNLSSAADGENFEWTNMYADFAKTARPRCGSAVTAGISWWAPTLPKPAPSAASRKVTSKFARRIIKILRLPLKRG